MSVFYLPGGAEFERLEDGGVEFRCNNLVDVTFTPADWCSLVANMSHQGENADTFKGAMNFHQGEKS